MSPGQMRWRPSTDSEVPSPAEVLGNVASAIEAAIAACIETSGEKTVASSSLGRPVAGSAIYEYVWALDTRVVILKDLLERLDPILLVNAVERRPEATLMKLLMETSAQLAMHVGEIDQLAKIIPPAGEYDGGNGFAQ